MWLVASPSFAYNKVLKGFPGRSDGKESTCNAGGARDAGSTPGSGRSLGVGHGKALEYSCLENPTTEHTQTSWGGGRNYCLEGA